MQCNERETNLDTQKCLPPCQSPGGGGYALFYGLYRDMAFDLVSILNRVYKFVRVCPKKNRVHMFVCVCPNYPLPGPITFFKYNSQPTSLKTLNRPVAPHLPTFQHEN